MVREIAVSQLLLEALGETLLDGEGVVLRALILAPVVYMEVVGWDVIVLWTVVFFEGTAALLAFFHLRDGDVAGFFTTLGGGIVNDRVVIENLPHMLLKCLHRHFYELYGLDLERRKLLLKLLLHTLLDCSHFHGTTITVLNASRKQGGTPAGKLFITAGLGGMSGAQPKAGNIAGVVSITAEINPAAALKRYNQGWVDEIHENLDELFEKVNDARAKKIARSFAYQGNVVDLWEYAASKGIQVDLGSDQTSLHNPFAGGYYPVGYSFEESKRMMAEEPAKFKEAVYASLRRHVAAINKLTAKGMYFFDYGNAFLLESSRAGADILNKDGKFRYPSYVQDIMGPMYFDYGFGPFRWVCTSGKPEDLQVTDDIACKVLEDIAKSSPKEIQQQMHDNIQWIKGAQANHLVVGSQARILYADCEGRTKIAAEFNKAIADGRLTAPVVLGRDHHDVSGTDSPFRETSNIYDGSCFTADMAIQNVIGDGFRGATWVSIHNGGGVGWGEVINGGFGMVLDGTPEADRRLHCMLHWDVNNGIARRSWARNEPAMFAIKRAMEVEPRLQVTMPNIANDEMIAKIVK